MHCDSIINFRSIKRCLMINCLPPSYVCPRVCVLIGLHAAQIAQSIIYSCWSVYLVIWDIYRSVEVSNCTSNSRTVITCMCSSDASASVMIGAICHLVAPIYMLHTTRRHTDGMHIDQMLIRMHLPGLCVHVPLTAHITQSTHTSGGAVWQEWSLNNNWDIAALPAHRHSPNNNKDTSLYVCVFVEL